jgi:hypothetical protein
MSPPKIERDRRVKFQSPPAPFARLSSPHADAAWKSGATGSTISFLSECGSDDDPSYESLQNSVTRSIESREVESSEYFDFNRRRALRVVARGQVDGVASKTQVVLLKKNECIYVLAYGAQEKTFDTDLAIFDSFVRRFEVPE